MDIACILGVLLASLATPLPGASAVEGNPGPDQTLAATADETAQVAQLTRAQALIDAGSAADALPVIDQVLARYAARYPEGRTRWYVARSMAENLFYLAGAAMSGERPAGQSEATTLSVAWADAWFLKGYAYNELGRTGEARQALEQARRLSPMNARYALELAETHKLERNWDEAFRLYTEAGDAARLSPPEERQADDAQARRGRAFVRIEQGRLDEAEAMLRECLALDPADARAAQEIEYIRQLRLRSRAR